MPIQFRCTSCNQKLAITRRKAGKTVKCPACAAEISVPSLDDAVATGKLVESPDAGSDQEDTPPPDDPPPAADEPATAEEQLLDEVPAAVFEDLLEDDDFPEEDRR